MITEHSLELRVSYAETDQMGIVYYSHYFNWFEKARIEYLRAVGLPYKKMEEEGYYLPVVKTNCTYRIGAQFDDLLLVKTKIGDIGKSSISLIYNVIRKEDNKILAIGGTRHALINREGKIIKFPEKISNIFHSCKAD